MKNNIQEKSFQFAIRIVNLCKLLRTERKEYTLSNQLLRSGTSIGANIREAKYAHSKADFAAKLQIALKECYETEYWLELLYESEYLNQCEFDSIYTDCQELMKLIVASTKTLQGKSS